MSPQDFDKRTEQDLGGDRREEGNTHQPPPRQVPKRKNHFFTWNNYTEEQIEELLSSFRRLGALKWAFQEEICPTTGTPHLQGMVMFPRELRDTVWDKTGRAHWEKLRKEDGEYQLKEKSRKPNGRQWTYGFPKPVRIIEKLYPWQEKVEAIYKTEPDDRKVFWFWEAKGNVGKSAFVKYMVVKYGCLFCDGGKKADLINLVFNANMDDTRCIMWDIPRASRNNISYSTIEAIKNGLVCNTKYETGVKAFNPVHVFVFANFPPDFNEEGLSEDRWVLTEL